MKDILLMLPDIPRMRRSFRGRYSTAVQTAYQAVKNQSSLRAVVITVTPQQGCATVVGYGYGQICLYTVLSWQQEPGQYAAAAPADGCVLSNSGRALPDS